MGSWERIFHWCIDPGGKLIWAPDRSSLGDQNTPTLESILLQNPEPSDSFEKNKNKSIPTMVIVCHLVKSKQADRLHFKANTAINFDYFILHSLPSY